MESYYARIVIVGITKQMDTRTEKEKQEKRNIIVDARKNRGVKNILL